MLINGTVPSNVSEGAAPVLFWEWGYTISGSCNGESPRLAAQRRDSHVKLLIEPAPLHGAVFGWTSSSMNAFSSL